MNILDKAKKLAQEEKDEHRQKLERKRKERENQEELLNAVRFHTRNLIGELHGKEGFSVKFNAVTDQHTATLSYKGNAIGCIVVVGETYNLTYGPFWRAKVAFCKTHQLWSNPITYVSINHEVDISKNLEKFSDQLATQLKGYF